MHKLNKRIQEERLLYLSQISRVVKSYEENKFNVKEAADMVVKLSKGLKDIEIAHNEFIEIIEKINKYSSGGE